MSENVEMIGRAFSRLTVISEAGKDKYNQQRWLCKCTCGAEIVANGGNLRTGNTNSCGCYKFQRIRESSTTHGHSHRDPETGKRGASPEYVCWSNIKIRCYDENSKSYKDYGGRGIIVCDRWNNSFQFFLSDMGKKPSPKHSIERMDTNGNYEPSNCRWATKAEQGSNKRNNHWIEYGGKRMTISEWGRELGAFEENLRRMMKSKTFSECVNYYKNHKRKSPCKRKNPKGNITMN